MRRFRGIPYMNEFRSVKQREATWEHRALCCKARPPCGLGGLSPRDIYDAVRGADCALQQRSAQAGIAFFIWEYLRCNVIYLGSLLLPDIHQYIGECLKEA
jgi:hypothetical protein